MTEHISDGAGGDVRSEALRRFVAATSSRAGAAERRDLAAWVGQDDDRRREIERLERIAADARALTAFYPAAATPAHGRRRWAMAAAACAACVAAVLAVPPRTVTADGGRVVRLDLGAGIRADLDAGAVVEVPRLPWRHSVRLVQGAAAFDVVHDGRRPFVVETAAATVTDLGTRFLVRSAADRVTVAVFEGMVDVSTPQGLAEPVAAGRALEVESTGGMRKLSAPDEMLECAWRDGRVVFRNHTLAEVAERLSRYSPRPVVVATPAIAGLRVSGTFTVGAVQDAVRAIEQVLPVRAIQRADAIVLEASAPAR